MRFRLNEPYMAFFLLFETVVCQDWQIICMFLYHTDSSLQTGARYTRQQEHLHKHTSHAKYVIEVTLLSLDFSDDFWH